MPGVLDYWLLPILRQTGKALFLFVRGEADRGDAAAGGAGHDAVVLAEGEVIADFGQVAGLFLHEAVDGVGVDVLIFGQIQRLEKVIHAGGAGNEPAAVRLLAEVLGDLIVLLPDLTSVMMPSVPPYSSTTTAIW